MAKKYLTLVENYLRRFERGGFLIGDIFKFNKDFKSSEEYTGLGQNVKDAIDDMIDSGLHIRVVGINDTTGQRYPGAPETASSDVELTIALDNTGGRFSHYAKVSPALGQPESPYPGLAPIPDSAKRKNKVNIKPKEVEEIENIANMSDRGDGKLTKTSRYLPGENTKLPSKSTSPSPSVASQTHQYLKGLARA
jgi:hypothetical protein